MKNIILIKFLIKLLLSTTNSFAGKYPNIPKGVNHKTYCDDKGGKYGHVIVVVDLTTRLDKARIEFIKDQVFSKEFYLKYIQMLWLYPLNEGMRDQHCHLPES